MLARITSRPLRLDIRATNLHSVFTRFCLYPSPVRPTYSGVEHKQLDTAATGPAGCKLSRRPELSGRPPTGKRDRPGSAPILGWAGRTFSRKGPRHANCPSTALRFHADRTPRRYCHHRDSDRAASARGAKSPRSCGKGEVPEQFKTDWIGTAQLRGCKKRISSGGNQWSRFHSICWNQGVSESWYCWHHWITLCQSHVLRSNSALYRARQHSAPVARV